MLRKTICSLLLMILFTLPAAAAVQENESRYRIEKTSVDVIGLTNERLLRRAMDFDFARRFRTFEELKLYVDDRRQILVNMRIFDEITYEIVPGEYRFGYRVEFVVDDAFTTLPIPYGTYDSNYGMKVGLKLFDNNLLGTLSDVRLTSFISQTDEAPNSWEYRHFTTELIWDNIPLFGSTLDTSTQFSIDHNDAEGYNDGELETSLVLKDLPLLTTAFSVSADLYIEQLTEGDVERWGNPDYTVGFAWKRLPFIEHPISIGAEFDLLETHEETGVNTYDISLGTTFHDLVFLFNEFDVNMGISYRLSDDELPVSLSTVHFGVSDSLKLPFGLTFSTSTKFVMEPRNSLNSFVVFDNSISRKRIDWDHNFRKGLEFVLSSIITYDTDMLTGMEEEVPSYTSLTATTFFVLGDILNFGARVKAFYSPDAPAYFMNNSSLAPGSLMRGILDKRIPNEETYYGGVLNTNAVFTFIDFPDFAEILVSPFLDVGVFSSSEQIEEYDTYLSGGIEVYWIFDQYRSYPFNVTVGADLYDVFDVMQGNAGIGDVEYEILMSLNLFY